MKRVVKVLLVVIFVFIIFFIVSCFVPMVSETTVFVGNTFENIISSANKPHNWTRWDTEVASAWQKDSSSCKFNADTSANLVSLDVPGKKIRITRINYLLYQLDEIKDNDSSTFGISLIPYVGNGQRRSEHNSKILYVQQTNLFFKMFPSLRKASFADRTILELKSYLEDNKRFYGFPIELKPATDTLFLTHKTGMLKKDFFKNLPAFFDDLEHFARENNCQPANRNLAFDPSNNDSISLLAGINIDKKITGDYLHNFMQLPAGTFLLVGHFEGAYRDKPSLYKAMQKFLADHQLVQAAIPYESYLSPLPVSDSASVKITLSYPLGY